MWFKPDARGYIIHYDLHASCESCLGPEHGGLALTPRASGPYCARLPQSEKRQTVEDVPVQESNSVDEAQDILVAASFAVGQELYDSTPSVHCRSLIVAHWVCA